MHASMSEHRIPYLEEVRHTPHICLAEGLRSANRAITKRYSEHMAGGEVNPTQASLLIGVYYLGNPTMLEIARHMETDRTTMARNVELLARSGHLEVTGGADRRARHVGLTERGRTALEEVLPRWRAAQEEMQAILGADLWQDVLANTRVLAGIGRRPEGDVTTGE